MFCLTQLPRLSSRILGGASKRITNCHNQISNPLGPYAIPLCHNSSSKPPVAAAAAAAAAATATSDGDAGSVSVTFLRQDGTKVSVKTSPGKTLYDAVIDNNVDIDGFGACEGTLCCTTCHLIFKENDYQKVGGPSDEEMDMLDLAYGLTDFSRLGCQVHLKKEYDPLEVLVPESINDVRES